jgi:hypothetical protein
MENIYGFNVKWDTKAVALFIVLLALPNLLGMLNLDTGLGFRLHTFQLAIFMAAILYGPVGGMLSGLLGSAYSAVAMSNPYIALGNAILGFFVGLLVRYGMHTVLAVALAFLIQLPWLVITDHFLVGMPMPVIGMLVLALAVSNTVWAFGAHYIAPSLKHGRVA